MATTVLDIIQLAHEDLGNFAPGEGLAPSEQTTGLMMLNMMWAGWSCEKESCFTETHSTYNLQNAVNSYTVGTGGTWSTVARPERITSWSANYGNGLMKTGGLALSIDEFNMQAKESIGATSAIPLILGADTASPLLNVRVHPIPNAFIGLVEITYWLPLTLFGSLTDVVTLPPGYEAALHFNLAVALYPQYERVGGMSQALAANAAASKAAIQRPSQPIQANNGGQ